MPDAAFEVLKPAVQSLLGGRGVDLVPADKGFSSQHYVSKAIKLGSERKRILVTQVGIRLTSLEAELLNQTAKAFGILFNRFESTGYKAHLRTAISASVMDITLARFLRGKRPGAFASVQRLIQVLKRLSYERYEGSPATTGFLVFRTKRETLRDKVRKLRCDWVDLTPVKIDDGFFGSPLTYRYVDGNHSFFAAGIQMKAVATIRSKHFSTDDAVDRLSHAELYRLLEIAGEYAFAAILNNSSEVEIILRKRKIIVWRRGVWNIFDPHVFHAFFEGKLAKEVINDLLWTVYSLSKTRHGTLILITSATERKLQDLRKGSVAGNHLLSKELIKRARDRSISSLKSEGGLIRMLSADGLTIVNFRGQLVDTGVITDTSGITKREAIGGGRTTAAIAASSLGKVIKVSEDGPIELYENQSLRYKFG